MCPCKRTYPHGLRFSPWALVPLELFLPRVVVVVVVLGLPAAVVVAAVEEEALRRLVVVVVFVSAVSPHGDATILFLLLALGALAGMLVLVMVPRLVATMVWICWCV